MQKLHHTHDDARELKESFPQIVRFLANRPIIVGHAQSKQQAAANVRRRKLNPTVAPTFLGSWELEVGIWL